MTSTPTEREYQTFRRGEKREDQLRDLREGLRQLTDPETGLPFTEDALRRATAKGSRFWREAESIDLIVMGIQRKDEFLAQQLRIDRAGSGFLRGYHSVLWGEPYLPAFGASGFALARGVPGTIWQGSTIVPDPFARIATDGAGLQYQVIITGSADANGEATLVLIAIDGGDETNLAVGTELRWVSPPGGSEPGLTVVDTPFTGGLDAETDADFGRRLAALVRHKPAAGNWSHLRTQARAASVSVEDAFVYPCAFNAGSALVAVTQKRGARQGPTGRVPSLSVLQVVTTALVPPASPTIPGRFHVAVVPVQTQPSDAVVRLAQPLGSIAGWTDLEPFPAVNGLGAVAITTLTSQSDFRVTASGAGQLPGGVTGPLSGVHLMVWDALSSAFESLNVTTVQDLGAGVYRVLLGTPPTKTLALGDWISPDAARRGTLAAAVTVYFDGLGPGEVIDLATDERSVRAFRNPVPGEEYPARAGQSIVTVIQEAMGSPVSDATLTSISVSTPSLPADPIDGPNLIVAGKFAVYPLA